MHARSAAARTWGPVRWGAARAAGGAWRPSDAAADPRPSFSTWLRRPVMQPLRCRCLSSAARGPGPQPAGAAAADDDESAPTGKLLSRAERRRRQRTKPKVLQQPKRGGFTPADRAHALKLWREAPVLFQSQRSRMIQLTSGLSATNALGWTWFTGTTFLDGGDAGEHSFQMSYWLTAAVLSISYGFMAFVHLYSTHYICELRVDDETTVTLTTHNMIGGTSSKAHKIANLTCVDARLYIGEYQRFHTRDGSVAFLIDVDRGTVLSPEGLDQFIGTIATHNTRV